MRYVAATLGRLDPRAVTGPLADGEVTVFQISLDDLRQQWTAGKPPARTNSVDFDQSGSGWPSVKGGTPPRDPLAHR